MAREVVAVFTYRTKEEIISSRGSEAWALNPQNAQRCRYLVCTRNRYTYPGDSGPEEHGAAFLVGRISLVEPSPERQDRFIIRFNEYALLDPQPVVWPGSRNPVWYLDNLAELRIDENSLAWRPVPPSEMTDAVPSPIVPSKVASRHEEAGLLQQSADVAVEDIDRIIARLDAEIPEAQKAMDALLSRLRTTRIPA
jgi:hypothetical protein